MKYFLFAFLAGLMIISCKKSANVDNSTADDIPVVVPAVTEIGQPTGNIIQQVIGPAGGSISSADGKTTLVVPAGALDNDQTITMQPIESKVPNGMETGAFRFGPNGLHFKKPAQLVLNYSSAGADDLFSPELLLLATQAADHTWKVIPGLTINKDAKTITAPINHFTDYAFFFEVEIGDDKTPSARGTVFPTLTTKVKFFMIVSSPGKLADAEDLVLPMPTPTAIPNTTPTEPSYTSRVYVREWSINGEDVPVTYDNGRFTDVKKWEATYEAPRAIINEKDTIAVTARITFTKRKGEYFIIRRVKPVDPNKLEMNSKHFTHLEVSAYRNNNFFQVVILDKTTSAPKTASMTAVISNFNGPGTYTFSDKTVVNCSDPEDWIHYKTLPNHSLQYNGTVTVTQGSQRGDFLIGNVVGTIYRTVNNVTYTGNVSAHIETTLN